MRLLSVQTRESSGRVRLEGKVRYDGDGEEELLWFDLPAAVSSQLSPSGNPWLVALLPLAVSLREPVSLDLPVDPVLLDNARELMDVWHSWYPDRPPVRIAAPASAPSTAGSRGTGLFFSGGVDSFHSLIRHNGPTATTSRISDLLVMHGADIPIADVESFNRLRPRIAEVASEFGAGMMDIATNLRATRWGRADWPHLSHGALLIAAGLVIEPRFSRLVIASSAPYTRLRPYGSHPRTDPLSSTSGLEVRHDGADLDRPDKILAIASHPVVQRFLRVCWLGRTDTNCGRCPKCLHTMVGLELAGMLRHSETLPRTIDPAAFRGLYLESRSTYPAYDMVKQFLARSKAAGRDDLVDLLSGIIARSDRKRFVKESLEGLARRKLIPVTLRDWLIGRLFRRAVKY